MSTIHRWLRFPCLKTVFPLSPSTMIPFPEPEAFIVLTWTLQCSSFGSFLLFTRHTVSIPRGHIYFHKPDVEDLAWKMWRSHFPPHLIVGWERENGSWSPKKGERSRESTRFLPPVNLHWNWPKPNLSFSRQRTSQVLSGLKCIQFWYSFKIKSIKLWLVN